MVSATYCDFKFKGENLDAHDWNGKSDPFFVIKVPADPGSTIFEYIFTIRKSGEVMPATNAQGTNMGYNQIYTSEIVKADLFPVWKPFRLDFYELCKGNINTEIIIECYDWDMIGTSDFIGSNTVVIKDILNSMTRIELMNKGKPAGDIIIESRVSISPFIYCDFLAYAKNLDAKDSCGTSDPYFVFKVPVDITEEDTLLLSASAMVMPSPPVVRGLQSHSTTPGYREVYESEVIMKTLCPEWGPFRISYYDLCRGDPDINILVECYDYNQLFSNVLIGSAEVPVRKLLESFGVVKIPLVSPSSTISGIFYLECIPSATKL